MQMDFPKLVRVEILEICFASMLVCGECSDTNGGG